MKLFFSKPHRPARAPSPTNSARLARHLSWHTNTTPAAHWASRTPRSRGGITGSDLCTDLISYITIGFYYSPVPPPCDAELGSSSKASIVTLGGMTEAGADPRYFCRCRSPRVLLVESFPARMQQGSAFEGDSFVCLENHTVLNHCSKCTLSKPCKRRERTKHLLMPWPCYPSGSSACSAAGPDLLFPTCSRFCRVSTPGHRR